ncbi:DUF4260 domain-containing protein [Shewanella sp. GXUN23E]|uniref:DUF4260 domain-containing protein n=1 Tax=Shewanella sp. GXUN23E TaxID=3422498 RepID=UPI003D7C8624
MPFLPKPIGILLRLEALAVMLVALILYAHFQFGWTDFALWFLLPDVALLGYLAGSKLGAACYNTSHSYLGPLLLLGIWQLADSPLVLQLCLIWFAHIGFDRALGYGLKFNSGFHDTHLGRIGRARTEKGRS